MNKPISILIFVLCVFSSQVNGQENNNSAKQVSAQEDCSETLKHAEQSYDQGIIEKVPNMLTKCLNGGFDKPQKIQAYKLIIKSYLFDDKQHEADSVMYKLLKLEPELEVNRGIEPQEFTYLYDSYKTDPIYSIGAMGGVNLSRIVRSEPFGVQSLTDSVETQYTMKPSYQAGLRVNVYLTDHLELTTGLLISGKSFNTVDTIYSFASLTTDESQTWLQLPLGLSVDFGKGKFRPYLVAAITGGLLVGANVQVTRAYLDNSRADVTGTQVDVSSQRNLFNAWATGGLGVKFKIKQGQLFLDARYNYGLVNVVDESTRFSNSELLFKYFYTDDNFTFDDIMISVGYAYSFYKPRKRKLAAKKVKSVKKKKQKSEQTKE